MKARKSQAVFLDRDGTINEEVGYLDRVEKLHLIRGAAEAIRIINRSGMKAVVVSNQSGVARGFFDKAFVDETHARLRAVLRAEGASIDAFYFCPHHPTAGLGEYLLACDCRKPAPGMLLRAAEELRLDLARSWLVGDTLNDIEAARRAGVRGILVRTGLGEEEIQKLEKAARSSHPDGKEAAAEGEGESAGPEKDPGQPELIAADLREAVAWIMEDRKGRGR